MSNLLAFVAVTFTESIPLSIIFVVLVWVVIVIFALKTIGGWLRTSLAGGVAQDAVVDILKKFLR